MKKGNEWKTQSWHCMNCGNLVTGVMDSIGQIKAECSRCHAVMVRIKKSRRQEQVSIYCPDHTKSD